MEYISSVFHLLDGKDTSAEKDASVDTSIEVVECLSYIYVIHSHMVISLPTLQPSLPSSAGLVPRVVQTTGSVHP